MFIYLCDKTKGIPNMLTNNYTKKFINELTIIQYGFKNNLSLRKCAKMCNVNKDKISAYYNKFKNNFSVIDILNQYETNIKKRGKKRLVLSQDIINYINTKIKEGWSIDVITNRDNIASKSTLYLRGDDLGLDMAKTHKYKRRKKKDPNRKIKGRIDMKSIHERDKTFPEVKNNTVFGHFEGDTIIGADHGSSVLTIVERSTKCMVIIQLIKNREAEYLKDRLVKYFNNMTYTGLMTITFDQGKEFARHKEMELEINKDFIVYFSDAGCPSQRGLCENNNSLIRRYLPKSINLKNYTQNYLNKIAEKYNNIPRKSLGYKTPNEILYRLTGLKSIVYPL